MTTQLCNATTSSGAAAAMGPQPSAAPALVSKLPKVTLVNAFAEPYNNAVATARTCYAPHIVSAAEVSSDPAAQALRDRIAHSIYAAGHHTTLQHATFQFTLENVSRHFVWSFLHAHPFYNSEQVSQRYVEVKAGRVLIPQLPPAAAAIYRDALQAQMECYQQLTQLLAPSIAAEFFQIFPARARRAAAYAGNIKKRAQEVARYALPVATLTQLYHTISGLTLHRYHRLCNMLDVPVETRLVVEAMVAAVRAHDPLFFARIEEPLPTAATHEYAAMQTLGQLASGGTTAAAGDKSSAALNPEAAAWRRDFDAQLGPFKAARLVGYDGAAPALLARSLRAVLALPEGSVSDAALLAHVLAPQHNPYLAEALNLTSLGKLTRALTHVHYTFQKKLSHTADSQDQRHRMVPAARPIMQAQFVPGAPDVVVVPLIAQTAAALDLFMSTMEKTWVAIEQLLHSGVTPEIALYLLPNAVAIRFFESGDLAALHHKWTTRLCLNAQEEIWQASCEEVQQVSAAHPLIGQYLGAPCHLRHGAGKRPYCPEGSRYCGVPVWNFPNVQSYRRTP